MLRVYSKAKNIEKIRNCFPSVAYSDLAYLDNAASTQTVDRAIKAVSDYHYNYRANVHRGNFKQSTTATMLYEKARTSVSKLLNCEEYEIAFTSGTTDSLNMIAEHFATDPRKVIITEIEHHSNILPWMKTGRTVDNGKLVVVKSSDNGDVSLEDFTAAVKEHPDSIVSFLTQSNFTGMDLPWKDMVTVSKKNNCEVVIDACQTIGHREINLQLNNIDWLVCSSHKMYGSTGTGIIFKRGGFSDFNNCYNLGGGTASHVDFNTFQLYDDFRKIEAGTPNIAGVLSMGAACDWIMEVGYKEIAECEAEFHTMLEEKGLFAINELELIGPLYPRSIYSFKVENLNPSDLASVIDMQNNVAVRTGHLCSYPASRRYQPNDQGIFRVSIAPYNNEHDCVKLVEGLWKAIDKLPSKSN